MMNNGRNNNEIKEEANGHVPDVDFFEALYSEQRQPQDVKEALPENNEAEEVFDLADLIDIDFDLQKYLDETLGVRTRKAKIYLLLATFFSAVGPLIFTTGIWQLPFVFQGYLASLLELISITCRFTEEDTEGFALDMTLTHIEGVRSSMLTVFLTIGVALLGIAYQGAKKCSKRKETRELINVLNAHDVKNAEIIADYEFSRESMRNIRHKIMRHGILEQELEELKEEPSRCERFAINIQNYRKECFRYAKMLFVIFSIPGIVIWMQKANSLADKIDCPASTVLWNSCPANLTFQQLALIAWPYASSSLGSMAVLTTMMILYFFTPKRWGEWFNDNIHQKILKFFRLREIDAPIVRIYTYMWNWGYILTLPLLAGLCFMLAYESTQEFAEMSGCASVIEQWLSIIFGYDATTPRCPQSTASLIFGGGVANLEVDKFWPAMILDETFFYALTFLLIKFTPIRRMLTQEHMAWFIKEVERCHESAMEAGYKTVLIVGVPLFYRAVNFALPILYNGITETVHVDDLSMSGNNVIFANMTAQQGAEKLCPYDSENFLKQLQKTSINDLAKSVVYIGDGNLQFTIAQSCPEYASYNGAILLFGLALGNKIVNCNQLTAIRFFSGFIAVYWSGISLSFSATYLPVFYSQLFKLAISACRGEPAAPEVVPMRPLGNNRHRLFHQVPDDKHVPLLNQDRISVIDDQEKKEVPAKPERGLFKGPAANDYVRLELK